MKSMLELVDVHRTYLIGESTVYALRGVSLTIEQGEFVAEGFHWRLSIPLRIP